ncbi:hypothetical protein A3K86_08055 [Photobacterium jeanii]|uniref:MSHA biogenesis protein MshK n=1 Tax=Photobacterium jeanii TaxID=858640 RepID=A0A178KKK9_9GAMM|nr:hypothetical protein [Photobacterium jeanii]OAN17505.1 hypothetical protein A3K86_08055 [Photobacterium jeanii]PST86149.1 hypothetical protein C9I91_21975 [Photobacterium jeanii]
MFKQRLTTFAVVIAALTASTQVMAQRDIQERRQEARQEARIESRTEARIENRHDNFNSSSNVVIIQNAMLRTVSYNGVVLLHDTVNQRFYRAIDNGYQLYQVPYGANVVELSKANPMNITIIN